MFEQPQIRDGSCLISKLIAEANSLFPQTVIAEGWVEEKAVKQPAVFLHVTTENQNYAPCLFSGLLNSHTQRTTSGVPSVDLGGSNHPPEVTNALQNRAKLNPIVKTVKNCYI